MATTHPQSPPGFLARARRALFVVRPGTVAVVHRLGAFLREAGPGAHVMWPLLDEVVGTLDMRSRRLRLLVAAETDDRALLRLSVVIRYHALTAHGDEAFHRVPDPESQVSTLVIDALRARISERALRDACGAERRIAETLRRDIAPTLEGFGYGVGDVVVDIELGSVD